MKYLIAGLGNIGEEYSNTRHNIGFAVVDALAYEAKATFKTEKLASVTKIRHKGRIYVLIKPGTYMNLSGKAVKYWLTREKIPVENLLVINDDIALPLGTLRMRSKGGDAGHNGLTHITETFGHSNFARLRFGIGNDFARGYQVDYVLGKWSRSEEKLLLPRIDLAMEMVLSFGSIGVSRTMAAYNNK